jgi:hypothetical protein
MNLEGHFSAAKGGWDHVIRLLSTRGSPHEAELRRRKAEDIARREARLAALIRHAGSVLYPAK